MQRSKRIVLLLCTVLILICSLPAVLSGAASGPSLVTTLNDNAIQRGSKKTFDVWARNAGGTKIRATVKHNGERLDPTWDDNEKASYTLNFTEEGENIVTVSASSDGGKKKELTYRITYIRAKEGEEIGKAIWSIEAFSIGCGYLIEPTEVPIYEGETSAEQLLRLLSENGLIGYYGGTVKSSFYLAYIADGNVTGMRYNNYQRSPLPSVPRRLDLSPVIPSFLFSYLEANMTYFDPDDYEKSWVGYLGEFAFTNGSGWMYAVNNVFPNVGFADCYLSDGDTVRIQFTLGYGADIGGAAAVGTDIPGAGTQPAGGYFPVANKDRLSKAICCARASNLLMRANVKAAYDTAFEVMATLNAKQEAVDAAVTALNDALENPADEIVIPDPDDSGESPFVSDETSQDESTATLESSVTDTSPDPSNADPSKENNHANETELSDLSQQVGTTSDLNDTDTSAKSSDNTAAVVLVAVVIVVAAVAIFVICYGRKKAAGRGQND